MDGVVPFSFVTFLLRGSQKKSKYAARSAYKEPEI